MACRVAMIMTRNKEDKKLTVDSAVVIRENDHVMQIVVIIVRTLAVAIAVITLA